MKFFYFYEDLLTEARYASDEKFEWILSNLEGWLFEKLFSNPIAIRNLKFYNPFRTYLQQNTNEKIDSDSDIVMAIDQLKFFLNSLNKNESQKILSDIFEKFPDLKTKALRFGKPEPTGKRGRPVGSKNKPKTEPKIEPEIDIMKTAVRQDTTSEPLRKGRPKLYDDNLTSAERAKYKKEGQAMIKSLESKAESLDNQVDIIINRIKKIMTDVDKRKKFFGIE